MMATIESTTMIHTYFRLAAGSIGTENRMNPYVPIFNRTPARMTEPAVGASVCASGSQVWNGNIGTLMAKAKNSPQNSHCWSREENSGVAWSSSWMSNVYGW